MVAGGSVELIAGQSIRFLPGLHVMSGGYLRAHITGDNLFCHGLLSQMPRDDVCGLNLNKEPRPQADREKLFVVYPNPGSGQFTIELAGKLLGKDIRMEVYASDGRLVETASFKSMGMYQICLSGQGKGIYTISLGTENKRAVERIILL